MSLGPNDLEPCGPDSGARKRHAAHGQLCLICEPNIERMGWCPDCSTRVPAVGEVLQPHPRRLREGMSRCFGSGRRVAFPKPVDTPIWVGPQRGRRFRTIALVRSSGGAWSARRWDGCGETAG